MVIYCASLSEGDPHNVEKLKRWFWSIFEKMTIEEKRELVRLVYTIV